MGQYIGATVPVVGLKAAPDANNLRRLSSWMRRYGADMDGSGDLVVMGYDRGNAAHSFNGPVRVVPSPTAAINATVSAAGVYTPYGVFQDSVSGNPALDPYQRMLWDRMSR